MNPVNRHSPSNSPPRNLAYGVKCVQNSRNVLEDAFSAHDLQLGFTPDNSGQAPSSFQFYGVYDGHGGNEAAQHAAASLHLRFREALEQGLESATSDDSRSTPSATANADALLAEAWPGSSSSDRSSSELELAAVELSSTAHAGSPSGGSGSWWANSVRSMPALNDRYSRNVKTALQSAFIATDAELAGTEVGEVVGTTAVVAVVGKTELFVAHCGDSRAVLCRKGGAIPLTSDHKPERTDEAARITSLGGKVVHKGGSHRVMGLLAMTRAIGDHFLRPYVISEPEVASLQRTPEDELLLLASDGLWDVFNCQEATTLALRSTMRARERGASASAACRVGASVLARGAIERGSKDNITVLIVDLRRCESAGSVAAVLASQCSDAMPLGFPHRRKRSSSDGGADKESHDTTGGGHQVHAGSSNAGGSAGCANSSSKNGGGSSSRSCGGAPAAMQPFSSVGGSSWGSGYGAGARFSQMGNVPALLYQQPPRPSHLEALATTWAAAAAVFSGRPQQRSSSSPGGGARTAGAAVTTAVTAAAGSSRSSAPGGSPAAAVGAGPGQPGRGSPFVGPGVASVAVADGAASRQGAQQQQLGGPTQPPAGAVPAQQQQQQQQQEPRASPGAMRSHSFSAYESNQRGRRQCTDLSGTNDYSSAAAAAAAAAAACGMDPPAQQQPQLQQTVPYRSAAEPARAAPAASAAAGVQLGGGFMLAGCCSAEKPPLPPAVQQQQRQQ